jgi:acyl-coenzyme A synthetase/AMP-(fatty) acid ligase
MVFKSPYSLTVPNVDLLTYLFTATIYQPSDKVWLDGHNPQNYITQGRAKELAQRIGHGLQTTAGITRPTPTMEERDVVFLISENQIMTPVTMFGIINAGAVVSTAAPTATAFEIARQIESCRPKLVICSPAILERAREGVGKSVLPSCPIAVMSVEGGKQELTMADGRDLISNGRLEFENITHEETLKRRVIFLGYSSGTTGTPKGRPPSLRAPSDG